MNEAVKGDSRMNQQPDPAARNRAKRDGFAALAVVILAAALIAMVINHFV